MKSIIKKDLEYLWHPYTQMKDREKFPPVPIRSARGAKLCDESGKEYYDTISSWWCNVHGHGHPKIKKAINEQLERFEHVLFAGFTHEKAVEAAEKLVDLTPEGLSRVFYSDNGSTAVEVALKMSLQYWREQGESARVKFVSLDAGYHGDTTGAMSVSGKGPFNRKFEPLLFAGYQVPTPYCYRCPAGRTRERCSLECLSYMEDIFEEKGHEIAGVILEPILLGAGGMIIYPPGYLAGVEKLAREHGAHLILDEVATGFGRTGKMFACEHAEVVPDLLCISKGVTSGYLPLGATLMTDEIFRAFYSGPGENRTFYHGHTFTANPLACAAACASMDLFEEEDTLANVGRINRGLSAFLKKASSYPAVGDTRCIGAVGAMELVRDRVTKEPFGRGEPVGMRIYRRGLENGVLLRPLGDVIYLFLPLCLKEAELDDIFQRTSFTMESVFEDLG